MIPGKQNARFVEIAESLKPTLKTRVERPLKVVKVEKDEQALMGWTAVDAGGVDDVEALGDGDEVIYDFGGHRAGTFEFDIEAVLVGVEPADAPCRLKVIFGEVLNDVAESFDDYKLVDDELQLRERQGELITNLVLDRAWVSKSWLPDEVINIDYLPEHVHMPRRHAFRYIKIQIISTSKRYRVKFHNLSVNALTSAPWDDPPALSFTKSGTGLSEGEKDELRKIDEVALRTLRNCMQTVYEDGPRRDMRLWIGDLRLQALCSYATFKDYDLAKRCLYLFAGLPFDDEGLLCACIYEKPKPYFGGNSIADYAMLFAVTLLDYVKATGDIQTGKDLFPIAAKQFEFFTGNYTEDLRYEVPASGDVSESSSTWHFVDWEQTLDKECAEHAIMIYCLKAVSELTILLDIPEEPAYTFARSSSGSAKRSVSSLIPELVTAHNKHYYDQTKGVYISGPDRQVSWASNAWAIIAGIPKDQEVAQRALKAAYELPDSVRGLTPYLHHYLCDAFITAGLPDLALKHIKEYWGSMVQAGAETFFEGWDPKDPRASPYGDLHSNSFCHAWSCTPALLLRQMGFE